MVKQAQTKKIGYFVSAFPVQSESFVIREIKALKKRNFNIHKFAIKHGPLKKSVSSLDDKEIGEKIIFARPDNFAKFIAINFFSLLFRPLRYFKTLRIFITKIGGISVGKAAKLLLHFFYGIGFSHYVKKFKINHIHAHFDAATNMVFAINQFLGTEMSFTVHASGDLFVDPVMMKEKLHSAKWVKAVSEYSRKFLDSLTDFQYTEKIFLVYNGVFSDENAGCQFYRKELNPEVPRIFSLGRLVSCKGFHSLIRVCDLLKKRGHLFQCTIMGDGPDRQLIEFEIGKFGLGNIVNIESYISIKRAYEEMAKSDIFVFMSEISQSGYRDGAPTVLLEAMLSSLPVVSTWISGIPEIVEDKVTGFLVHERDIIQAANAVEILLKDETIRKKLGNAGKKRVLRRFNQEKNIEFVVSLLGGNSSI